MSESLVLGWSPVVRGQLVWTRPSLVASSALVTSLIELVILLSGKIWP